MVPLAGGADFAGAELSGARSNASDVRSISQSRFNGQRGDIYFLSGLGVAIPTLRDQNLHVIV